MEEKRKQHMLEFGLISISVMKRDERYIQTGLIIADLTHVPIQHSQMVLYSMDEGE